MARKSSRETEIIPEEMGMIPVEANLEIPPLFQMRRSDPEKRLEECWTPIVTPVGERLDQYWRVSVAAPHELPGPFDQDVWFAVQTLVFMRGGMPADGIVPFSMYELLGIMGKPDNGDNFRELRESLLRLQATQIYSEKAFYSKDVDKFETRAFSLWDVTFSETTDRRSGRYTEAHQLAFSPLVRRSFQAEYLKALDKDFYYSLNTRYAKRLYRLIDAKRLEKLSWSIPLERFRQLLPLPRCYKTPGDVRKVLKRAHGELQEGCYLEDAPRFEKRGREHVLHYRVNETFAEKHSRPLASLSAPLFLTPGGADSEEKVAAAVRFLNQNGVWKNVARELVSRLGAEEAIERCRKYVRVFPFLENIGDRNAWLAWAIREEYVVPDRVREKMEAKGKGAKPVGGAPGGPVAQSLLANGEGDEEENYGEALAEPDPDAKAAGEEVWAGVMEELREKLSLPSLSVWFEGTEAHALAHDRLVVVVPNEFAKEYIETRFKEDLEEALNVVCPAGEGKRVLECAVRGARAGVT